MANADTALFKPELVFFDMECKDREDFFQQLHDKLDAMGYIKDTWLEGITTREKNYPTGLRCEAAEIAMPHDGSVSTLRSLISLLLSPRLPFVLSTWLALARM